MKKCSIENCGRRFYSTGMCQLHYKQFKPQKENCSVEKCVNTAFANGVCHKHYQRDYMAKYNEELRSNPETADEFYLKQNEWSRDKRNKNNKKYTEIGHKSYLKRTYGLTSEQYKGMLAAQNGVCAICEEKCNMNMNLCVDHDHITGKIRGLLCNSCNRALGLFKDKIKSLRAAAEYLEKY
jgi:Recombination endonuclease VII